MHEHGYERSDWKEHRVQREVPGSSSFGWHLLSPHKHKLEARASDHNGYLRHKLDSRDLPRLITGQSYLMR